MHSSHSARLAALVGRGEQQAFAELYDLTSRDLYGYLQQRGGHDREASAVLADVYLEVWATAPRFAGATTSPQGWITGILSRLLSLASL